MFYENSVTDADGKIYTVDMLRYKFEFYSDAEYSQSDGSTIKETPTADFVRYLQKLSDYVLDVDVKYYPRFGSFDYRHLWVIKFADDDSTVTIGIGRGTNKDSSKAGFIEYNPNKVHCKAFRDFLCTLRGCLTDMTLVRYDLAVDFLCNRSLARLDMNGLKKYELHYDNGTYTEYSGVRNHNGRVKLYDKRAESGLDYDLTRLEYTIERGCSCRDMIKPYVSSYQMSLGLCSPDVTTSMRVIASLLLEKTAPERNRYLKDFDSRTRKKIEPLLQETVLQLDDKCLYECEKYALALEIS